MQHKQNMWDWRCSSEVDKSEQDQSALATYKSPKQHIEQI